MRELAAPLADLERGKVRRPGGGRKRSVDLDPTLRHDLEALIEPTSRGDPISPLRWTTKSLRPRLAAVLGHAVSYHIVADLLLSPTVPTDTKLLAQGERASGQTSGGQRIDVWMGHSWPPLGLYNCAWRINSYAVRDGTGAS